LQTKSPSIRTYAAIVEWDAETHLYVGIVPGFPGAHTQAAGLDELRENLREVIELCLGEQPETEAPRFGGIQHIEIDA
jgi:predicted RNase H-like HicB family nuclease